jgi:hypothetical protein
LDARIQHILKKPKNKTLTKPQTCEVYKLAWEGRVYCCNGRMGGREGEKEGGYKQQTVSLCNKYYKYLTCTIFALSIALQCKCHIVFVKLLITQEGRGEGGEKGEKEGRAGRKGRKK